MSYPANSILIPGPQEIAAARERLASEIVATPTFFAPDLSDAIGEPIWLKAENLQRTGSFKARGALNWVLCAQSRQVKEGLVTVSAGNHAMALAWAAQRRQLPVTVVMPAGSSPLKIELTRKLGAEVIIQGSIQQAVAYARHLASQHGLTLVHPYDDFQVMAGQATAGLEIIEQAPDATRVLVPIGGGGLISGLGLAIKAAKPKVEIIGVEPDGAATMRNAWNQRNHAAALPQVKTIAASLAPAVVSERTYAASRKVVDSIVTVDDAHIVEATRMLMQLGRLYIETGAAVGLAALLQGRVTKKGNCRSVLVITGGNIDPAQARAVLGQT